MYEPMWDFDLEAALAGLASLSSELAHQNITQDKALSGISNVSKQSRNKHNFDNAEVDYGHIAQCGLPPANFANHAKAQTGLATRTANELLKPANWIPEIVESEKSQSAKFRLDYWLDRIRSGRDEREIFSILDEFRPLEWTDQERAQMSHVYFRRLEYVKVVGSDDENQRRCEG